MVSIVTGLVGGFVATIVMTGFMMALGDDSPPPTALLWSQYVGDEPPEAYVMQGMALHFVYGTAAGGVLAAILAVLSLPLSATTLVGGTVWGVVWGVVLFLVSAAFWMNVVLDIDAGPKQAGMFLFFHLVYGVVLGVVLGVTPL